MDSPTAADMTQPLRTREVAQRLGCHVDTVRHLVNTGDLPATRITPRRFAVDPADLADYLRARRVQPTETTTA